MLTTNTQFPHMRRLGNRFSALIFGTVAGYLVGSLLMWWLYE